MRRLFRWEFEIAHNAIDGNQHVNNIQYIQWMQDIAIAHAAFVGGTAAAEAAGGAWYTRSHHIEYLSPAFEGERLLALTWVTDLQRVRSCRRYRFLRAADHAVLADAESLWVFVDAKTGRPRSIPPSVTSCYEPLQEDEVVIDPPPSAMSR